MALASWACLVAWAATLAVAAVAVAGGSCFAFADSWAPEPWQTASATTPNQRETGLIPVTPLRIPRRTPRCSTRNQEVVGLVLQSLGRRAEVPTIGVDSSYVFSWVRDPRQWRCVPT